MKKQPDGKYNKEPALPKDGLKPHFDQLATPDELRLWFIKQGHTNMAICTGRVSNIVVIDCDTKEAYAKVVALGIPLTPIVKTRRGYHIYFKFNHSLQLKNGRKPDSGLADIDVKTTGGYVICPSSRYEDGTFEYTWIHSIIDTPLAEMPEWLITKLATSQPQRPFKQTASSGPTIGTSRIDSLIREVANAAEGTRNDTLNRTAFMAGTRVQSGEIALEDARSRLIQAGIDSGLDQAETTRTVDSALASGMAAQPMAIDGKLPPQIQIADMILHDHDEIAFTSRGWMQYRNGIWREASENDIGTIILGYITGHFGTQVNITSKQITSIREIMACTARAQVDIVKFDADRNHLVFTNGVLRIDDAVFGPHCKDLYATIQIDYDYDPNARPVNWERFIQSTFTPEVSIFLQEYCGYALTNDTSAEMAVWLHGPRGSGKSTFIEGVKAALGPLCGYFGLNQIRNQFGLSPVQGKTLLYCTEQPTGYIANSDVLNTIISGEPIQIERKYREAYEYRPYAKLLWAMNETPRVPNADNGLFRRIRVLNFADLPASKRDPALKEAIKREKAGIINWLVEGLRRLRANGMLFNVPSSIQESSQLFQQENDIPAMFIEECADRSASEVTKCITLYTAYRNWCVANGHKPACQSNVGKDWTRLGFSMEKKNGARVRTGLSIKPEAHQLYVSRY